MEPDICQTCRRAFFHLKEYNSHQKFHKHLPNVTFKCLVPGCHKKYKKYLSFYMHLYRTHSSKKRHEDETICAEENCDFIIKSKSDLSSHVAHHIKDKKIARCPVQFCENYRVNYTNISTWRSHVFRKHSKFDSQTERTVFETTSEIDNSGGIGGSNVLGTSVDEGERNDQETENDDERALGESYLKSLSLLYLNLQTKYFLTDKALDAIIDGVKDINDFSNEKLISYMSEKYDINISQEELNKLNYFTRAHKGRLRSSFTRKQYYKEQLNFVAPVSIGLDASSTKEAFFYYIPILETLKALLQNKEVRRQIFSPLDKQIDESTYCDITDGSLFKKNPFFQNNPQALRIILFQDAFEVCNPLGARKKIYKIVGIYMILGNTHPCHWSKVDNISLVALVFENDVKKFGFDKVFDTIIKDLKVLEINGINVEDNMNLKGSLVAMLGDNLGSHQIGGFTENFSTAEYVCRYCYIQKQSINSSFSGFSSRSKETYEEDVLVTLASNEVYRGVKHDSILNSLTHYHVCSPGLPPCLAHDLYEGVVVYDVMLALNYFSSELNLSLETLNTKIQSLKFEHFSFNLPAIKSNSPKLVGTAHDNIIFLQILPFLLFDFISSDDPVFKMMLLLRQFCNTILSFKLDISQIACLKSQIEEYMEIRMTLFPETNLRPKHHYLLHYAQLILQFGPLRHLWTLRCESKHKYFKSLIKHSMNFKNILHTFAERHQLLQSFNMSQSYFSDEVTADHTAVYCDKNFEKSISEIVSETCTFEKPVFVSKKVTFRGVQYKSQMYICFEKTIERGNFLVLKIDYILINRDYTDIDFIGHPKEILYDSGIGLYHQAEKSDLNDYICVNYKKLLTHEALYVLKIIDGEELFYFKSTPLDKQ